MAYEKENVEWTRGVAFPTRSRIGATPAGSTIAR
jgi:hypothetical protein